MKLPYILSLFLLATQAPACKFFKNRSDSSTSSLVPSTKKNEVVLDSFKLGFAEKNGIKNYQVVRELLSTKKEVNESLGSVIRVRFGNLNASQFKLLMDHYGGQNFVTYDPNRKYELEDFLPPKVQALLYRWLIPTAQTDTRIPPSWGDPNRPGESIKSIVEMNCWSTAYEVLRDWDKPWATSAGTIAHFGPKFAEHVLWNNELSIESKTTIDKSMWEADSTAKRNEGRKPGDVLYIKTKDSPIGPAHVAIWIDDDLYFEKTNSTADDPIRLSLFSDVVKPYLAVNTANSPTTMSFVRYKLKTLPAQDTFAGIDPYGRQQTPLPPELQKTLIFSLERGLSGNLSSYSVNRILNFRIEADAKTGRAIYVGADVIKNFLISDEMCTAGGTVARDGSKTISYKITMDLFLYIFNPNGQQIAKILGVRRQNPEVVAEFPTTDQTWTLRKGQTSGFLLSHPAIKDELFVSCAREDFFRK